ncbi:hypothetical protein EAF04_001092 [Stromatinia cepivora]|nr:hypothetical protein EAF04_001092 [Stromatinia cepivora]
MAFCGIFYATKDTGGSGGEGNLSLVSTSLHTTIKATTLHTSLAQTFDNPSKNNIPSCRYEFPLYDGISIVKFTCTMGNKKLSGVIHEKAVATKIYEDAKNRGETAGLLEQNSKASDVFSTSLGNIPAGEKVVVEIEYIGELKMEGGNMVKLTIPTKVAPRFGWSGSSSTGSGTTTREGMKITVDVLMWESMRIDGLTSPSHPIAITIGALSPGSEKRESNKASATLAQESAALEQDFVLLVNVKDLGNPKAMLETHSTISNHRALMVSLVPKFTLPAHNPEIVFVVDRSGSMQSSMSILYSAMSFLWPQSKPYTQDNLEEALDHIGTFQANFGMTNTLNALTATIQNRLTYLPLEIILLTDGDIWRQEECFKYLNGEVKKSQGAIRVFPLGIGNGVSHALLNGIARAGNGFPQAVQRGESMDNSAIRMLRGALYPHITDYTMEVKYESEDDDFEIIERVTDSMKLLLSNIDEKMEQPDQRIFPTISLFDPTVEEPGDTVIKAGPRQQLPEIPAPKLLQAPHNIPSLFPGVNTVVYLLMSPETIQRNPAAVVLRGISAHGPVELSIPIERLPGGGHTIHQLAARKATQDLEEGRGWVYDAKEDNGGCLKDHYPSQFDDIIKREAVRMGQQFQVANRWCSFVAVAENDAEGIEKEEFREFDFVGISKRESRNSNSFATATSQQPRRHQPIVNSRTRPADDFRSTDARHRSFFPASQRLEKSPHIASDLFDPNSSSRRSVETSTGVNSTTDRNRLKEVVIGNDASSNQKRSFQDFHDVPAQQPRRNREAIPSPILVKRNRFISYSRNSVPVDTDTRSITPSDSSSRTPIKKDWAAASSVEKVLRIIDLQQFDGTWVSLPYLEPVLGFKVPQDVFNVEKDTTAKKLWITLIVIDFLEHTMTREAEIWEIVVVKTKMWLNSMEAQSVQELKQMKKTAMEVVRKVNQTTGEGAVTANDLT